MGVNHKHVLEVMGVDLCLVLHGVFASLSVSHLATDQFTRPLAGGHLTEVWRWPISRAGAADESLAVTGGVCRRPLTSRATRRPIWTFRSNYRPAPFTLTTSPRQSSRVAPLSGRGGGLVGPTTVDMR